MAKRSFKLVTIKTPPAPAIYPYLTQLDEGKYAPDGGQFKVTLALDPSIPAHAEVIERIEAETDRCFTTERATLLAGDKKSQVAAKKLVKGNPLKAEEDDEGNPTGRILITFKRKAITKDRDGNQKTFILPVFDASGAKLDSSIEVWGGSVVEVAAFATSYYVAGQNLAGASFKLSAVLVRELVTRGGGTAEGFGFETNANAAPISVAPNAAKEDGADDDDDDDDAGDVDADALNF